VLGDILTMSVMWTLLPLLGLPLWEMPRALVARSMMLALTVALGFEVGARAIPFERLGIAWMRLAPVHAWRWVFGRYVGILAIALPIVSIATVAVIVGFRLGLEDALGMIAVALPALMVALALGLWTGAAFGNFAWSHPRAMLTVTGRLLATLMLLGQAVAWLMLGLTFDSLAIAPYLMLAAMVASIGLVAGFQALAGYTLARRLWS
jgi:hypothetical protein